MDTQHTPGPWTTNGKEIYEGEDTREHCGIATVNKLYDEYKANARLISAAPDMLEALRALAESCNINPSMLCAEHQKRIRAAIAKATACA